MTQRAYAERAAEAAKLTPALGEARQDLKSDGDDVTIKVEDNTPEIEAKLNALHLHLEELGNDPTKLRLVADTDPAERTLDGWRMQAQAKPLTVPDAGADEAGGVGVQSVQSRRTAYSGRWTAGSPSGGGPESRLGGVSHALGGFGLLSAASAALPNSATIQAPAGKNGLVQWAENSTGGEAYIPLGGGARSRSIWAQPATSSACSTTAASATSMRTVLVEAANSVAAPFSTSGVGAIRASSGYQPGDTLPPGTLQHFGLWPMGGYGRSIAAAIGGITRFDEGGFGGLYDCSGNGR